MFSPTSVHLLSSSYLWSRIPCNQQRIREVRGQRSITCDDIYGLSNNPGQYTHLKILNLITLAKSPLLYKVTQVFQALRPRYLWGPLLQPHSVITKHLKVFLHINAYFLFLNKVSFFPNVITQWNNLFYSALNAHFFVLVYDI